MSDASPINLNTHSAQDHVLAPTPSATLTTEDLEETLFEIIVNGNLDASDLRLLEVDEHFAKAAEQESEAEYRSALCQLISLITLQ
ncbi:MAG: hypothetical protein ACP5E2_14370 [Terracidiphilus sp.]